RLVVGFVHVLALLNSSPPFAGELPFAIVLPGPPPGPCGHMHGLRCLTATLFEHRSGARSRLQCSRSRPSKRSIAHRLVGKAPQSCRPMIDGYRIDATCKWDAVIPLPYGSRRLGRGHAFWSFRWALRAGPLGGLFYCADVNATSRGSAREPLALAKTSAA